MLSSFRKPQRRQNFRSQRKIITNDSSDEETKPTEDTQKENANESNDDGPSTESLNIAQFREKKSKKQMGSIGLTSSTSSKPQKAKPIVSFHDEDDDGEVFQVKKSSQSRRIIKQKKAEKKKKEKENKVKNKSPEDSNSDNEDDDESDDGPQLLKHQQSNVIEPELDIKFKDNVVASKVESWTLSGREAEALHMEEDDLEDSEDEENSRDAMPGILQSGQIPDAAAIYAARKKRQAARERGEASVQNENENYISIDKNNERSRLVRDDEHDKDSDEDERINFTGVKSSAKDKFSQQNELNHEELSEQDDDKDEWEEMQIRKAMISTNPQALDNYDHFTQQFLPSSQPIFKNTVPLNGNRGDENLKKPVAYNLEGIKARLKERLEAKQEVHRRHLADEDRAVDDLIDSQTQLERLDIEVPSLSEKHKFYQELRGYVTDYIECYNEKIVNIAYLEDKFYKSKSSVTDKLMERRREDIRDQMIELSGKSNSNSNSQVSMQQQQKEAVTEAARQRRTAEREGRRRRRAQQRQSSSFNSKLKHNDGMSSDDELSSLEQANIGKTRQDIETQARQVLSDVVEDFSTISGVKERMEEWKKEDFDSYNDAYVSLCLPKIFSPLVRLQLLFWSPFMDNNRIEDKEFYKTFSCYSLNESETKDQLLSDPDRKLLSLLIEKVVVPKISSFIKAAYDPLSTTQTIKVTQLLKRFISEYPTVSGDSKQIRELVMCVKDRLLSCVENDPYIPIGYAKQIVENPNGAHAAFTNRQFWITFKLLKNTLMWYGILSDGILAELALNSLINRYLLIALGVNPDPSDATDKARQIVAAIPKEWLKFGLFKKELERLSSYLLTLGTKGRTIANDLNLS